MRPWKRDIWTLRYRSSLKSPSAENVLHCRLLGLVLFFGWFWICSKCKKRARWNIPQVCWKAFHISILGKAHRKHLERWKKPVGMILEGGWMELLSLAFKEEKSDFDFFFNCRIKQTATAQWLLMAQLPHTPHLWWTGMWGPWTKHYVLFFLNAFSFISLQISFAAKAQAGKQLLVQPAALVPCFQHSFPQFSRRLIGYRLQRLSKIT